MPRAKNDLYARALGVSLRAARKYRNWSMTELARKVNVSRSAVASWEDGRGSPSWAHLVTFAIVCNVKLSSLIISVEKAAAMIESQNDPTTEPAPSSHNTER
jgi:transcriptional regulator with XRE-family HTH domain